MANKVSAEECISLIIYIALLVCPKENQHSTNVLNILDAIGRLKNRRKSLLSIKCKPSHQIRKLVTEGLKAIPSLDYNCIILVHPNHLIKLKIISGSWVTVVIDSHLAKDRKIRLVKLYPSKTVEEHLCYASPMLYNNCVDPRSKSTIIHLVDYDAYNLPKSKDYAYYTSIKIPLEINSSVLSPCFASKVLLSLIEHPHYKANAIFEQELLYYFNYPKLICVGDVLAISIFENFSLKILNHNDIGMPEMVYFSVNNIECSNKCRKQTCHLVCQETGTLHLIESCHLNRIPYYDSVVGNDGNINIPPHLEEKYHYIKSIIKSQIQKYQSFSKSNLDTTISYNHQPHLHSVIKDFSKSTTSYTNNSSENNQRKNKKGIVIACTPKANSLTKNEHAATGSDGNRNTGHGHILLQGSNMDTKLLLQYLEGSLGCCFYHHECSGLVAEGSGPTETKVMNALINGTSTNVPAVVVLHDVDAIIKGTKNGQEDSRVCIALCRCLQHLAARSIVVIGTCDTSQPHDDAVIPGGLWKLFSYQEIISSKLSASNREELAKWFMNEKYVDYIECQHANEQLEIFSEAQQCSYLEHKHNGNDSTRNCDLNSTSIPEETRIVNDHRQNNIGSSESNCVKGLNNHTAEKMEGVSEAIDNKKELMRILTDRTVGYNYAAMDVLLNNAVNLCCEEWDDSADEEAKKVTLAHCPLLQQHHLNTALEELNKERRQGLASVCSVPRVEWKDVGGLDAAKKELVNAIHLPLRFPHLMANGMRRAGVLLYGPPGTGKTLLAKAVASECGLNFLSVKGPELLNMYVGQSEQNVRKAFEQARRAAPCVVFFDEMDALTPSRGVAGDSGGVMDRVVSAVLSELDQCSSSVESAPVFVLAATNRPDLLDSALLRPGRFEKLVYLGPCTDAPSLLKILQAVTNKLPLDSGVELSRVVQQLPKGLTGADLASVATEAFYMALRGTVAHIQNGIVDNDNAKVEVTEEHLLSAAANVTPSVSEQQLAQYKAYNRNANR